LIKLYPSDNHSVKKSIDTFYERITEFLDEYEKLMVMIGEFSFSYKGETVFQDEEKQNSLPFFFFKDGMRELSFYDGLKKRELKDFLVLMKEESVLPLEDSDMVSSLWAKDFAHIRYFAIDEFLDTDIGKGGETGTTDIKEFSKGSMNLTPEDKIELYKRSIALGLQLNPILEEKEDDKDLEDFNLPYHVAAACEGENPELKSMLLENREIPSIVAMANLLFEILFLEERHDQFSATLNVLYHFYKEVVHKSNFSLACLILARIQELKGMLPGESEEKEKSLEIILEKTKDESFIDLLKELFLDGRIEDYDSFFQYLTLLRPNSIPLAGDVWEHSQDPFLLQKASTFLQEIAQENIAPVAKIAGEERVTLTKEVIAILGRIGGKQILPYLINFSEYKHKPIRLEIIHALSKIKDKTTNKILLRFLSDENGEVRTRAAMNLRPGRDKTTLNYVMQLVQEKDFNNKGKLEKKALMNYLASTKNGEVIVLLEAILKKWSILSTSKHNETRLCAISALATMATPEAVEIIKEGTKMRNKAIRNACSLALKKIDIKDKPNQALISEQSA
jgi:HEAT repeat protein